LKLLEIFYSWRIDYNLNNVRDIDAVVTMAFYPKLGNPAIAKLGRVWQRALYMKPLIVPREVAEHLTTKENVVAVDMIGSGTTHSYLQLVAEYCKNHDLQTVVLIAHPDHYCRSLWTAQRLGLKVIPVECGEVPFDDDKPRVLFIIREICARVVYLFSGKI